MKKGFKVIRTWYVEAKDVQGVINKSKNWDHDEVVVAIKKTAPSGEEEYTLIHDENMYDI
jgi:hypothetical protein